MKFFIFFLAFFLVVSMVFVTNQDTYSYFLKTLDTKTLAEDAAKAGALSSMDDYTIDKEKSFNRIESFLKKSGSCFECEVKNISSSAIAVRLKDESEDLFRISTIPEPGLVCDSVYEWVK